MNGLQDKQGFSLLEVLIGVAIFMFGMLGVAAIQISSIKGASFSGNVTEAAYLAVSKLEALKAAPYDPDDDEPLRRLDDDDGDGTSQDTAPNDGEDDYGNNFGLDDDTAGTADGSETGQGKNGIYSVFWNIAVDEPMAGCKTINVIVKWSVKGSERKISLGTYKAEVS